MLQFLSKENFWGYLCRYRGHSLSSHDYLTCSDIYSLLVNKCLLSRVATAMHVSVQKGDWICCGKMQLEEESHRDTITNVDILLQMRWKRKWHKILHMWSDLRYIRKCHKVLWQDLMWNILIIKTLLKFKVRQLRYSLWFVLGKVIDKDLFKQVWCFWSFTQLLLSFTVMGISEVHKFFEFK